MFEKYYILYSPLEFLINQLKTPNPLKSIESLKALQNSMV